MRAACLIVFAATAPCLASVEATRVWADELTNTLGAPSRDGRFLSFVDVRTGDLAIRDLESGAVRRLTRNDSSTKGQFAYFSTVSPDSKQVAYAWFNDQKFYDLRIAGIDGSQPRILFRNEEAGFVQPCAWSPDGRWILTLLFRKDNISQIALVPTDGSPVRVLKSLNWIYPKRMDFSADGKFIVYDSFDRDRSPERDLFVLAVDGSREAPLVQHPANDLFPLWSPEGDAVFFASDRSGTMDLWRVPVRDGAPAGEPSLVKSQLGRFLPMGITSGGKLYYGVREGLSDIYIGDVGKDGSLMKSRFPGRNSSPEWSPDGKFLAYLSRRGTENYGEESRAIVVRTVRSAEERELKVKLAHVERVRWSPDGRTLLVSGSDNKGRGGIFTVDLASERLEPVVAQAGRNFRGYEAAWSPDGESILYSKDGKVYRRNLADGAEKETTAEELPHSRTDRSLHPDGRRVAFTRGETRSELWELSTSQ
jgi:Tol biopolymer transport system component